MELFTKTLQLQVELLLLMIVGYIAKKAKVIDNHQQKGLSELLINIILPANIIKSFISTKNITNEYLFNCFLMILICLLIQLFTLIVFPYFFKRFDKTKSNVMEYGMLVSNSSFIGIPVVEYLYGSIAVTYTAVFQIPLRIFMWTAGVSLFTENKSNFKEKVKLILTHPCIISVVVGFILMVSGINMPLFLNDTIKYLSNSTTPISMLVIGAMLADIDVKHLFDFSTLYFSFLRLVAYPLFLLVVLNIVGVDKLLTEILVLMTAMPCGSTCAILAQKYGYDYEYASKIIFVSSLFSIVTIPIISLLF